MTTQVKICGLTRAQDVEAAILYGADYLGFIVEAKSKRRLSINEAAKLSLPAKDIIPRVAVTVNASDDMIAKIITDMQPDYIQFHGDETADHIARIATRYGVKTIKALPISTRADIIAAMSFAGFSDMLLFDAKPPKPESARGGHGLSFNWNILKGAPLPKSYLLAGGINPNNIKQAMATGAPILDVSSGVESAPGIKDSDKIRSLIQQVKL